MSSIVSSDVTVMVRIKRGQSTSHISVSSVWSEHIFTKGVGGGLWRVEWWCNVTWDMLFGKHAVVILQTQTESSGKISVEAL